MTQPSLLDLPEPVKAPNPVKVERDRLNAAAARVLARLQASEWVTNVELAMPCYGGLRFGGRLHELKHDGWIIEKDHVDQGTWRYRLIGRKQI